MPQDQRPHSESSATSLDLGAWTWSIAWLTSRGFHVTAMAKGSSQETLTSGCLKQQMNFLQKETWVVWGSCKGQEQQNMWSEWEYRIHNHHNHCSPVWGVSSIDATARYTLYIRALGLRCSVKTMVKLSSRALCTCSFVLSLKHVTHLYHVDCWHQFHIAVVDLRVSAPAY